MTYPKRMTAEMLEKLREHVHRFGGGVAMDLLNGLDAERAHSAKVEARCEELRQRNIERHEKQFQKCSCCQQRWAYGAPELHLDGCIAAPTEKT